MSLSHLKVNKIKSLLTILLVLYNKLSLLWMFVIEWFCFQHMDHL